MNEARRACAQHRAAAALVAAGLALACLPDGARAAERSAVLYDGSDGATCDYFNYGARIAWRHRRGDWIDARRAEQGTAPFAKIDVRPGDETKTLRIDVTGLYAAAGATPAGVHGLLLRLLPGSESGAVQFHSREAASPGLRPSLVVDYADGKSARLPATADSTLDCSTFTSLGEQPFTGVSSTQHAVLRFNPATRVARATLELSVARTFGPSSVGVYALDPLRDDADEPARAGIAARYPRDQGIERDPAVIMATGFEEFRWQAPWSHVDFRSEVDRVGKPGRRGFEPLVGQALEVGIPAGKHLGMDVRYRFADAGTEPDEVYFRYYLRFASDWDPKTEGGKLPGISATYSSAGWGGRKADADKGWSMRGLFLRPPATGNPFQGGTPIGTYAYHADMETDYGDNWTWSAGGRGVLERNRWYCIEQYVKVNQPGRKDGVLRAWVDGHLVLEKSGIRLRDSASLHIEQIWMNVYYGGLDVAPSDMHLFIDNVVVARDYIGPMRP